MKRLENIVALITGVGNPESIGYGIAKVFAREGAKVVCVVRRSVVFDRVRELKEKGLEAYGFMADLSKTSEVDELVKNVISKFGNIDVLVNVAGGGQGIRENLMDLTEENWNKVMNANLRTCMLCTKAVLRHMIDRKKGKIVNVSSVTGPMVSVPKSTAYSASKGAVSAFTRSLALEVAEFGITVNSICPGWIDTGKFSDKERLALSIPMKRLGTPEETGYLALFLSTDDSSYITGQDIVIDGGNIIQERKFFETN
jgi:3-oxoacyl-[acyl-carrier protein] reductase